MGQEVAMTEQNRSVVESHRIAEEKLRLLKAVVEDRMKERSAQAQQREARPRG